MSGMHTSRISVISFVLSMGNFAPHNSILLVCLRCRGEGVDPEVLGTACMACDAYKFRQSVCKYEDLYGLVDACIDDQIGMTNIANEVRDLLGVAAGEATKMTVIALYHLKEVSLSDRYDSAIATCARLWGHRKDPRRE